MTKRHSTILGSLRSAAGLAFGYRQTARRASDRIEPLRPQGSRAAASKSGTKSASKTASRDTSGVGDRGQNADSPGEIPVRGWIDIAKRTAQKFSDNQLMAEAASVTFFALLSIFPAITAIVSIYGLFADPSMIQSHLDGAAGFIPSGGMEIVQDQVKRLTQSPPSGLSTGAAIGILVALWSANQGAKSMLGALNDVYGERETRGFVKVTAVSLAFTVGGIFALLIGLGVVIVAPLAFDAIGLSSSANVIFKVARWPVVLLGLMGALAVLYRFGPSRHRAKWRWISWGGAIGAASWLALSTGFSWYVEHFGNYNKTYGSLGAVIGFMTWMWLSSTVLLLGAQINAEMETQTARDTTVGGGRPLGQRGAAAADTVA